MKTKDIEHSSVETFKFMNYLRYLGGKVGIFRMQNSPV